MATDQRVIDNLVTLNETLKKIEQHLNYLSSYIEERWRSHAQEGTEL
jgi:hypothetical protein